MGPFGRLLRKIRAVRQYPRLAFSSADRRELWILGLRRNRVPASGIAAWLALGRRRVITPRLALTRGQRVRLQLDDPNQVDVFDELFVERVYDLDAVGFEPALVADCGAFCGYFSAMAAGAFPRARCACFEANRANVLLVEAQLALLGTRVELHPCAVHVRDGVCSFSGGGVGGAVVRPGDPSPSTEVACIDFPRWLRDCAPEGIVWKLDVEGAEIDLLPATLPYLPRRTVCFLETHHPDAVCAQMLAPYRDAGFSIREVRSRLAPGGNFSYIEWLLVREA
jgi:FkbM family methyltransferase